MLHLFNKKQKQTGILWNVITIYNKMFLFKYILKCNLLMWCKAELFASLLQSSVSHDLSEIILIYWFAAQETFLIISSGENIDDSYVCGYFFHY